VKALGLRFRHPVTSSISNPSTYLTTRTVLAIPNLTSRDPRRLADYAGKIGHTKGHLGDPWNDEVAHGGKLVIPRVIWVTLGMTKLPMDAIPIAYFKRTTSCPQCNTCAWPPQDPDNLVAVCGIVLPPGGPEKIPAMAVIT
jgi:hypothetical protein